MFVRIKLFKSPVTLQVHLFGIRKL